MNDQTQELLDISGGIVFSTIYNTNMQKSRMSITDQIIMKETDDNILDIFLTPKSLDYNNFRHLFYPTNSKHFQMSVANESSLFLSNWLITDEDGTHKFVLYDFVISAIEHHLGISRNNFNPALKIHLEKELIRINDIRKFNRFGTVYALSWSEISTLLEQIGVIYNRTGDNRVLLTLILNYQTPLVDGFIMRFHLPFIVDDIYKEWNDFDRLPLLNKNNLYNA